MSPSASLPVTAAAVPSKGNALVIGSPSTAAAGSYQSLIRELEMTRRVDKEMLDRLVDGGELKFQ